MAETLLTVTDVCDVLNVSRTTVWRLSREQKLRAVRLGRLVRFRADDVAELITSCQDDDRPAGKPGDVTTPGDGPARDAGS